MVHNTDNSLVCGTVVKGGINVQLSWLTVR